MLKPRHKTKVLEIKKVFVNSHYKLLQLQHRDYKLIRWIEEGINLCEKVLRGFVKAKYFNDHLSSINLALESYVWFNEMRGRNLIAEE